MKKYYIPQTGWFSYNEFIAQRVRSVVGMAGGREAAIEELRAGQDKVVTFNCPEEAVANLRASINRLYGCDKSNPMSVYER